MSERLQRIEAEALSLPPEEREALAGTLLESLEGGRLNEVDAAWIEEVERREEAVRRGEMKLIPAEKVFSDLRRKLKCE
jgi:putative addiction module component (TIGR02574 family)